MSFLLARAGCVTRPTWTAGCTSCPPPACRPQEVQERWFATQIELAEELQLQLFLHCRDAGQRFAEILRWVPVAGRGLDLGMADAMHEQSRAGTLVVTGVAPRNECAHSGPQLQAQTGVLRSQTHAGRTGAACRAWHTALPAAGRSWSSAWSWACTLVRLPRWLKPSACLRLSSCVPATSLVCTCHRPADCQLHARPSHVAATSPSRMPPGITGWICDDRPDRGAAQLAALLPLIPGGRALPWWGGAQHRPWELAPLPRLVSTPGNRKLSLEMQV